MLYDNSSDSHRDQSRLGRRADIFLSWCQKTSSEREKIKIAKKGLKYVDQIINEKSVPAMMICLELSKIIKDKDLQRHIQNTIHEINEAYVFDEI